MVAVAPARENEKKWLRTSRETLDAIFAICFNPATMNSCQCERDGDESLVRTVEDQKNLSRKGSRNILRRIQEIILEDFSHLPPAPAII